MKKILIAILFFFSISVARAQYGNEWIKPNVEYFKFPIVSEGLFRLPIDVLINAGIDSSKLKGKNLRLYRYGQPVAFYTTNPEKWAEGDFLEFLGSQNDGTVDAGFYRNPLDQLQKSYSLITDTAYYFLAVDSLSPSYFVEEATNDIVGVPPKEEYYWHTSNIVYKTNYSDGQQPTLAIPTLYDSQYSAGEGYTDSRYSSGTKTKNPSTSNRYLAEALDATVNYVVSNTIEQSTNNFLHQMEITVAGARDEYSINGFGIRRGQMIVPVSGLGNSTTPVNFTILRSAFFYRISSASITYPKQFNFDNQSKYSFNVKKSTPVYLEISNFNRRNTTPVLYDFKNLKRYEANISGNVLRFHLSEGNQIRDSLYLSSQATQDIGQVSKVIPVNFINHSLPLNQGSFIILTSKKLLDDSEVIKDYENFRSSPQGGSYNVLTVYIDEIEEQFGYGIKKHPLAIRNFINFLLDNASIKPSHLLILGKGIQSISTRSNANNFQNSLIQPYGDPPTDVLLVARSAQNIVPQIAVGRVSAVNSDEIRIYLNKLKEHEAARVDTIAISQTLENKQWMKRVLHLGGGNNAGEQSAFRAFLNNYKNAIEGPSYGATVTTILKTSSEPIQIATSALIDSLINNGISLITYFGHSSASTLDFNLVIGSMRNKAKYFVMLTNGCFVGNIYGTTVNYSERIVINEDKAAIAYIAPFNFGLTTNLNNYSSRFYDRLSKTMYGSTLGEVIRSTVQSMTTQTALDILLANQMIFHGDPGINLNTHNRPDYIITAENILFNPSVISTSNDQIEIKVIVKNIGKAVDEEMDISVTRVFQNGLSEEYSIRVDAPYFIDSFTIIIPNNPITAGGLNTFTIKIDSKEEINELSEFNNQVTIQKQVLTDDIVPIYPYEFSITDEKPTLKFSFESREFKTKRYFLEIDTTELFNSPIKEINTGISLPGLVEWKPSIIPFNQNVVYYFRSAIDTASITGTQEDIKWNNSSFLYNVNYSSGWNQSHYFQYLKDEYFNISLRPNRIFTFAEDFQSLKLRNGMTLANQNISLFLNDIQIATNSYIGNSGGIIFFVFDIAKGRPLESINRPGTGFGTYDDRNSFTSGPVQVLAYLTNTIDWRERAIKFLQNNLPDQYVLLCYNFKNGWYSRWGEDSITLGTNLFQEFEKLGATQIRNAQQDRTYTFFVEKSGVSNKIYEHIGEESSTRIDTTFNFSGVWNEGAIRSTLIGPARAWNELRYNWNSLETTTFDEAVVNLYGISSSGGFNLLKEDIVDSITDISFIDHNTFPFLRLEFYGADDSARTAPQLDYWRVIYEELPDAAVNPALKYSQSEDTLDIGEALSISLGVTNISNIDMDSLLVKFTVISPQNQTYIEYRRYAPLLANSSYEIDFDIEISNFPSLGVNNILVEINPDKDQPEQFTFNNFATFTVYLSEDKINPILDVTFDGMHIVEGDIVSPNPEIVIRLMDENLSLPLNDTAGFEIFLVNLTDPQNPIIEKINLSRNDIEFVPAQGGGGEKNEARIYFRPTFTQDGNYELRVQAKDRSNNVSGENVYRVGFKVITRIAISNFLNYPNPFTTSTRFVFTITGKVPDKIKIQILTITGKVVRVVTQDELGPIRVGNNISRFAWDGTDQYGDRLGNGVYLYRVIVEDESNDFEHHSTGVENYFNKEGFGKMYMAR
jgi:hypothetical protein